MDLQMAGKGYVIVGGTAGMGLAAAQAVVAEGAAVVVVGRDEDRAKGAAALLSFLVDSSAIWRLQRQPELTEAWHSSLVSGAVGSCEPQRAEFRRSARNATEFDEMDRTFRDVYPDVPVPKSVSR